MARHEAPKQETWVQVPRPHHPQGKPFVGGSNKEDGDKMVDNCDYKMEDDNKMVDAVMSEGPV